MPRINLGEPYESFIKSEIESGLYSNATEVIRDALRRMQEDKERRRIAQIHALIAIGDAQLERGEGIPYTADFMDKALKRAVENQKTNKPIRNEVKPKKA